MTRSAEQLLIRPGTKITCPKCVHEFSLEQGFAKKALEKLEEASAGTMEAMREAERAAADKRAAQLASERERAAQDEVKNVRKLLKEQADAHAKALAEVRALAEKSVAPQVEELRKALAERDRKLKSLRDREAALAARESEIESRVATAAAAKATELFAAERQALEQQLAEQGAQVATLRNEQLELRKERQQLKDEKDSLALEVQKQVDAQVQQREAVVRAQEAERSKLREADLQKKLDDLSGQLADAQRKAEQGSQQLQGEVLELAIEEALRRSFPLDSIEEVKKGVRGGDVIQRVTTRTGQPAGVILWETKRAKDWSPQWAAKLKDDMRGAGADVGVLVTMPSAIPKEWEAAQPFGLYEEVWITTWSTAVPVAEVLRSSLLDVHKQRLVSAGKGEKMEAVYDYLTSPQFAQKLRAVYGAFRGMQEELQKERSAADQRFARRERQIQTGMKELLGFAGDVQGLSNQELPMLQLEAEEPGDVSATGGG